MSPMFSDAQVAAYLLDNNLTGAAADRAREVFGIAPEQFQRAQSLVSVNDPSVAMASGDYWSTVTPEQNEANRQFYDPRADAGYATTQEYFSSPVYQDALSQNAQAEIAKTLPRTSFPTATPPVATPKQLAAGSTTPVNLAGSANTRATIQTVGGGTPAGWISPASAANYQSDLIRSLRNATPSPQQGQGGVTLMPNQPSSQTSIDWMNMAPPTGLSNNVQRTELPEWDPTPIFQEIYGRGPTPEELAGTRHLKESDLRTSLNYWWDQYQQGQKPQAQQQAIQAIF